MTSEPKLREVRTQPALHQGRQGFVLTDPLGICQAAIFIPASLAPLLALMDGTRGPDALRTAFQLRMGMALSNETIHQLVSSLDQVLLLDNQRFAAALRSAVEAYRAAPYRAFTLPGNCCPSDPAGLSQYFDGLLSTADHDQVVPADRILGVIVPHIDFPRGGPVYADVWSKAGNAIREAELVIILGTDHAGQNSSLTLTRQSYQTPWGTLPTATSLADEIARIAGDELFKDELHHSREHSVETAALWVHYLMRDRVRPVLPVLCGSMQEYMGSSRSPATNGSVGTVARMLSKIASGRRTVFVAAADLAHVGPVFGDPHPLDTVSKTELTKTDERLMQVLAHGDPEAFLAEISAEGDRRRVCGVPPVYLMLLALSSLDGLSGIPAGYAQCPASEDGGSIVSICGMVYRTSD